jgi:hypothetical protein
MSRENSSISYSIIYLLCNVGRAKAAPLGLDSKGKHPPPAGCSKGNIEIAVFRATLSPASSLSRRRRRFYSLLPRNKKTRGDKMMLS